MLFRQFNGNDLAFGRAVESFEVVHIGLHTFEVLAGFQVAARREVQG